MDIFKKTRNSDMVQSEKSNNKRCSNKQLCRSSSLTNSTEVHKKNNATNTKKLYKAISFIVNRLEKDGLYRCVSIKDLAGCSSAAKTKRNSRPKNTQPPRFETYMMTGDLILNLNANTSGYSSNIHGSGGSSSSNAKSSEMLAAANSTTSAANSENRSATVNDDASRKTRFVKRPNWSTSLNERIVWTFNAPVAPKAVAPVSSTASSIGGRKSIPPHCSSVSSLRRRNSAVTPPPPPPPSPHPHLHPPASPKRTALPFPNFPHTVSRSLPMKGRSSVKLVRREDVCLKLLML